MEQNIVALNLEAKPLMLLAKLLERVLQSGNRGFDFGDFPLELGRIKTDGSTTVLLPSAFLRTYGLTWTILLPFPVLASGLTSFLRHKRPCL